MKHFAVHLLFIIAVLFQDGGASKHSRLLANDICYTPCSCARKSTWSRKSMACGSDGLIYKNHCALECAKCEGSRSELKEINKDACNTKYDPMVIMEKNKKIIAALQSNGTEQRK